MVGQVVVQGSEFSVDDLILDTPLAGRMGRIMDQLILSDGISATLCSHGGEQFDEDVSGYM
jgi:hypothetical protein